MTTIVLEHGKGRQTWGIEKIVCTPKPLFLQKELSTYWKQRINVAKSDKESRSGWQ